METVEIIREVLEGCRQHPCVSVIVPTHWHNADRSTDSLRIDKALMQAKSYLRGSYSHDVSGQLQGALDELLKQVNPLRLQKGVGFFVAPGYQRIVHFYMPVKERILVGNTLQIRDLLYEDYFGHPYLVVQLSENDIRLFNGRFNELVELRDDHFPMFRKEEYEYSKPVRGSSSLGHTNVKAVERDKAQLEKIRVAQFFRQGDELLDDYLPDGGFLVVTGTERGLSSFTKLSRHSSNVAAWLPGHHDPTGNSLSDLSWSAVQKYLQQQLEAAVAANLDSMHGRLLTGIIDCWNAVEEGRGQELMVEIDYTQAAFLSINKERELLYLRPPRGPHTILPDVINELMIRILKKGGKVLQVANDSLRSQGRLVLYTRY